MQTNYIEYVFFSLFYNSLVELFEFSLDEPLAWLWLLSKGFSSEIDDTAVDVAEGDDRSVCEAAFSTKPLCDNFANLFSINMMLNK